MNENLTVNSFDFGPDGYLYAPSFFTGEVLRIDVDSCDPGDGRRRGERSAASRPP